MSYSETITKNDLKAILDEVLLPPETNPPVKVHIQTIPSTSYPQSAQTSAYAKGWTADTISGYTPVACLQATPSNYGRLSVQIALDYENYGDSLVGFVFNPYTSALVDTILLPILYIRNDLYT